MPSQSIRKTRLWPGPSGRPDCRPAFANQAGSIALIVVFVFFAFATLGLGTVSLTQTFLKLSAYKKNALILGYTAENGVKQGLARVSAALGRATGPSLLSAERLESLAQDARAGRNGVAEEAMNLTFPDRREDAAGEQTWAAATRCALDRFTDAQTYFLAEYRLVIESEGRLKNFAPAKTAALDLALKTAAGRIPLSYFPFLLSGAAGNGKAADLVAAKKLELLPSRLKDLAPRALVSARSLIPQDPTSLLAAAAKIKFIRPGQLDRADLRRALGLDMIDEPVPDGVYLLRSDSSPQGIFVQGDLDQLLLAIDAGWQYIDFLADERSWRLKFSPAAGRMEFRGPEGTLAADRVPLGMILVNGAIGDLAAAEVGPDEVLTAAAGREIPCLLNGVALTIVSAEAMTIGTHLLHEGVKWMENIPYLTDKTSQLVVYAGGRDLIDGTERDGRIFIGPNAPADIKIQASLTAATSFVVEGEEKTVVVSGGLQTADLDLGAGRLKIAPDERIAGNILAPAPGPAAAEPVLLVLSVRPLTWTEPRP
jgi:hypothetical protein